MESKATPNHQTNCFRILPAARRCKENWLKFGIETPWFPAKGNCMQKIFKILFVKELCFQSKGEVGFSFRPSLLKRTCGRVLVTNQGGMGRWTMYAPQGKKLNFGEMRGCSVSRFRPLSYCHYSTMGALLALLGQGMDLCEAVVLNQGWCRSSRAPVAISGVIFGCHNLGGGQHSWPLVVGDGDTVNSPAVHRTVPHSRELSCPKCQEGQGGDPS